MTRVSAVSNDNIRVLKYVSVLLLKIVIYSSFDGFQELDLERNGFNIGLPKTDNNWFSY